MMIQNSDIEIKVKSWLPNFVNQKRIRRDTVAHQNKIIAVHTMQDTFLQSVDRKMQMYR